MRSRALSRRTLLRGTGVAVGLPLLEAMLPRPGLLGGTARGAAGLPTRLVVWAWPNGTRMNNWNPSGGDGPLTADRLSPSLSPFAPAAGKVDVLPDLTWIVGLNHKQTVAGDHDACYIATGGPTVRNGALSNFPINGGPSIDQVLAAKLGGETRLRSMPLSNDKADLVNWAVLSWDQAGKPVQAYRDPKVIFDTLFGGAAAGQPSQVAALGKRKKSVLDFVLEDARQLSSTVGAADRLRIDEHMAAVRELEKQIAPASGAACAAPTGLDFAARDPLPRGRVLMQLLVMALKCDATRYITFNFENSAGEYRFPGISWRDHEASHSAGDDVVLALTRVKMEEFAFMLRLMKGVNEGAGTLLDSTLVLCSSEIGNGRAHDKGDMPVLIAGRGGGMKSGRILRRVGANYNDMLCSLLNHAGLPTAKFGVEGTGPLAGL